MSRRKKPTKAWTLTIPAKVTRPKGSPVHLMQAVEWLAPYKGIWVKDDRSHQKLSKKLAIKLVTSIARRFNSNEHLARDAPRFNDVMIRLKELKKRSDALAKYLENLDDITVGELEHGRKLFTGKYDYASLRSEADVPNLRKQTRTKRSPWTHRLFCLSRCAEITLKDLLQAREREGRSIKDRGGNTNKFKEDIGIPRWRLVTDLLCIYGIFKPGEATATEGKPFHQFVLAVFEYATGKEGETFANVGFWIKRIVGRTRLDEELRLRGRTLTDRLEQLVASPTKTEKEVVKTFRELSAIFAQRKELWAITWPHVRLNLSS